MAPEYRETVRAFYRGLASLEVGLLDDAQAAFERAAALAPDEPAIRANLAVVHVGFGNEAEAAGHIEAARGLAPDSAEVRFQNLAILLAGGGAGRLQGGRPPGGVCARPTRPSRIRGRTRSTC